MIDKTTSLLVSVMIFAATAEDLFAECSAQSETYSRLWNAELQAGIDARIEKHRTADGAF